MNASEWFLWCWLFAFGACFGSFLNVVIYRVPAGLSLIHPGSHCPKCKHAIRAYDNVPVLAWCWLGGACRDCRLPIPIRYPLVEALIGVVLSGLALPEILGHGGNFPGVEAPGLSLDWFPSQEGSLWWTLAAHFWLICVLIAAGFMLLDDQQPPARFRYFTLGVCLALSCLWLVVKPVPAAEALKAAPWSTGPIGLAVGVALAGLLWPLIRSVSSREAGTVVWASGAAGATLGWQAVVVLVPLTTLVWLVDGSTARLLGLARRIPWPLNLAGLAMLYIIGWRWAAHFLPLSL